MSVQICEGVWRNRSGQRLVITQCKRADDRQQWTDGDQRYSDNGSFYGCYGGCSEQDLVEHLGPLPDSSQRAPVSRPAETESTTARYISTNELLNEKTAEIDRLRTELEQAQAWRTAATDAHSQSEALRIEQTAEIARLQAERQSEFNAAQQLRSEVAQLERLLDDARDNLRALEADGTAMDHHCEGMKAAFLAVIKTFVEMRS
jgi:molecular chaperone GrpE (heat shock protein)